MCVLTSLRGSLEYLDHYRQLRYWLHEKEGVYMWVGCMLAIFEACSEKPVKMYAVVWLILAKTKRCGLGARQRDVG